MIHVDTSFIIRSLAGGTDEDAQMRAWVTAGEPLGMAAPAWAEFLCGPLGPAHAATAATLLGAPLPFGAGEAAEAARLFNHAGRRRGSLPDCMIAATAIHAGAPLATSNPTDFRRFVSAGLKLAFP